MVEKINEIKKDALDTNIPIMQDDTIDFITDYIKSKKKYNILEIGTAVGYSSIVMASCDSNVKIVTIEKDKDRYDRAVSNIKYVNLESRITYLFGDALDFNFDNKFDLIIIDAAKSKNIEFFKHFENNLMDNGTIITDNINFHGFVNMRLEDISSRNVRGLVKKIRKYKEFLNENELYFTTYYDFGDGISVSERGV